MSKILISIVLLVAIAFATDVSVQYPYYSCESGQYAPFNVGVTDIASVNLKNVTYQVVMSDPTVEVSYPAGAAQTTIGTITPSATGWGAFEIIGNNGFYYAYINITYKKSGDSSWKHFNYTAEVDIGSSGGGSGKRFVAEPRSTDVVVKQDADLSLSPAFFAGASNQPWWFALEVAAGVSDLTAVSYLVEGSDDLTIAFPPAGANIDDIAAGNSGLGSFMVNGPEGLFELTATITYTANGEVSTFVQTIVLVLSDDSFGFGDKKRSVENLENNNSNGIQMKAQYVVALVAGVAVVAVAAVVVALVIRRKQSAQIVV